MQIVASVRSLWSFSHELKKSRSGFQARSEIQIHSSGEPAYIIKTIAQPPSVKSYIFNDLHEDSVQKHLCWAATTFYDPLSGGGENMLRNSMQRQEHCKTSSCRRSSNEKRSQLAIIAMRGISFRQNLKEGDFIIAVIN